MNINIKDKTVLFCVLNWGLGHASRSISIIRNLECNNCTVIIASDGVALSLLKSEFPDNIFYELPSYGIKYLISPLIGTLISLPKLFSSLIKENRLVSKIITNESIDLIISDNRYGTYSAVCDSYLITHQLNPFFFVRPKIVQDLLKYLFSVSLSNFSLILIPDDSKLDLTGVLSKNNYINTSIKSIGILSRFPKQNNSIEGKRKSILIILSGPEPSRTNFEKYLFSEMDSLDFTITFVLGRKIERNEIFKPKFIVKGIVTSLELFSLCRSSNLIVSRSGYSSIMDYLSMEVDAILIPTPGLPEQEYLAERMQNKCLFHIIYQRKNLLSDKIMELLPKDRN